MKFKTIIKSLISKNIRLVAFYDTEESTNIINIIKKIKKETQMVLSDDEALQIFNAIKSTNKIEGDIAEVGVYKGGSAKLISEANQEKELHLFDTFNGLPGPCQHDDNNHFKENDYIGTLNEVEELLKDYSNINFYKGIFPQTSKPVKNKKFSFIHLDVDLYESTKDSLEFFYPRMSKGAILISHDYTSAPGVKKAFDEFFKYKLEPIIEIADSQCLIVKVSDVLEVDNK